MKFEIINPSDPYTMEADDLVPLRLDVLLDALDSDEPVAGDPVRAAAERAQVGNPTRRPSVEILFHALVPEPLVLHLHPLTTNALTCNERGESLAAELNASNAQMAKIVVTDEMLVARSKEPVAVAAGQTVFMTNCIACHGPNGNSTNPEWPNLAGQNAAYIAEQLRLFRAGQRSSTPNAMVMTAQAAARSA